MKIGITQYAACPWDTNEDRLLQIVRDLGLSGIEPLLASPKDRWLNWPLERQERFAATAKQQGISIPSVAVGIFNDDASLIEPEGQPRALDIIGRTMAFTATLSARVMLLCCYLQSHPDTPAKMVALQNILRQLDGKAAQLDIQLGLEAPLPAEPLAQLVDELGSDRLGVYYDLGNAIALGYDPAEEIGILGNRILSVHIKDSGDSLNALHLGDGTLDLTGCLEALGQINYGGWLILETPYTDDAAVARNVAIVRRKLKQLGIAETYP